MPGTRLVALFATAVAALLMWYPSPGPAQAPPTTAQAGMSRADVLQKFGQPTVTVATSSSETLYFRDGTSVTLQNGQVIGSK